jgi:hypothetical protein
MGYVYFDLTDTGSLHTLASPGAGVAGALPGGVPTTGGFYVIFNQANNNRYVGKAGDLRDRFNGRMLTVNEFGLSQGNLGQIGAFWGEASVHNTPMGAPLIATVLAPVAPPAHGFQVIRNGGGAAPILPNAVLGNPAPAINYAANQVMSTIDGQQINLEALLIRLFRQIGVGGTMTNLVYMGPFTNPAAHELIVQVEWGACGVVGVPHAHFCIAIPPGGAF